MKVKLNRIATPHGAQLLRMDCTVWAMLEAEAYAEAMRFILFHELAETVREAAGAPYVDPHPTPMQVGCWDEPMKSLK